MRILLIEDQEALAYEVKAKIVSAGYEVDRTACLADTLAAIEVSEYAIALLDRRLPDGDGLSLVSALKRRQPDIRIMILSALDAIDARIEGLEAGADDYLSKPFDLDEMIARVRAHVRSTKGGFAPPIKIGELTIDLDQRQIFVRNETVVFSRREHLLLESLARRANCLVSREVLHRELYGQNEAVQERALTSIVSRVRARLDALDARVEIWSARALGYIMRDIAESGELE